METQSVSFKTSVYGIANTDYPSSEVFGISIFPKVRHQSFPKELEDQFKHMQSNFSTGLFPLISRAWMAIDSDLFLWNFETNADLAFYEGILHTILLVDLVKVKPGFSQQDIHFFLVVATTVDILLLPLAFRDEFGNLCSQERADFKNSYAYLVGDALFKLPLDGLIVTNICCTSNGRIFFSADDSLYEMEFYEKTWFSGNTCKKINYSKGLLNSLVPVLYIFSSKDDIRQLELDDTKHILYALFQKGSLQVFYLGTDGKSIQKLVTLAREQIEYDSTQLCNVNSEYFKEIISVSAITLQSDYNNNFVLTTSKGVRIYFSCLEKELNPDVQTQITHEMLSPKTLRITQIKFPPNELSFTLKGVNIYTSYIFGDTSLMASNLNDDETNFWIFTSSNFVCSSRFDEHSVVSTVNGCVWKIVKSTKHLNFENKNGLNSLLKPDRLLIEEQHLCPAEKFFVLTSKGVSTYLHLSPVEIFRQILHKYGTESKQFQSFAMLMTHREICVMAIIVLCSDNPLDNSIKDVALRAFFVYGGEAQIQLTSNNIDSNYGLKNGDIELKQKNQNGWSNFASLNSPKTPYASPKFHNISLAAPLRTSTPQEMLTPTLNAQNLLTPFSPAYNEQSIVAGSPTIVYSARHDALYLYFQRILYTVSHQKISYVLNNQFMSSFTVEQIDSVLRIVATFKRVIDENFLITQTHSYGHSAVSRQHINDARDSACKDKERLSLSNLRNDINLTLEVLNLWAILLEHNYNVVISSLSSEFQKNLLNWYFEDLVKNRENICTELITKIIQFYMGDNASTNIISKRLRESCPSIFTNDDALVVKATENLYRVKLISNKKEKMLLIEEAISTLLQSIQKLNLVQTCDLLIQINYFPGIVELALAKANKDDVSKLALIAYKKQINATEAEEINDAIRKRNDAYSCITDVLELLNLVAQSKPTAKVSSVTLNTSTFLFPSAEYIKNISPAIAKVERDEMIRLVFQSDDELANVAVFRWLLSHGMTNVLLESHCRFFESFLFHEIEEGKGNKFLELLWKYYEKNQNYLAASKVLAEMATKTGSRATLEQRITYLSHALVCIQSEPETKSNLELKTEIQDQLDVAQIQMRTKNLLEAQKDLPQFRFDQKKVQDAIQALNHELLNVTTIYDKFATTFNLSEIKLDILQCAGHYDNEVVEQIWKTILDRELYNYVNGIETDTVAQGKLGTIINKLKKHFLRSPKFVPTEFILRSLLVFSFKSQLKADWLPNICKTSEIPYSTLINVISYEYRIGDPFWQQNKAASQFVSELAIIVCERFVEEHERLSHNERRVLRDSCLNFLSTLLLDTHFKNGGVSKNRKLEILQTKIEKILP